MTVDPRLVNSRQLRCEPTQWISQWKDQEPLSGSESDGMQQAESAATEKATDATDAAAR